MFYRKAAHLGYRAAKAWYDDAIAEEQGRKQAQAAEMAEALRQQKNFEATLARHQKKKKYLEAKRKALENSPVSEAKRRLTL